MSIFGAMQSGISGLAAQSTAMGAISDNIVNVNTVGYKNNNTSFQTLVTKQTTSSRYSPGGVQPVSKQGVNVQGLLASNSSSTACAISGNGYFVVNQAANPGEGDLWAYTRAGDFNIDDNGYLVNTGGFYAQGWSLLPWDGNPNASVVNINGIDYMKAYYDGNGNTVYINDNIIDNRNLKPINLATIGGTATPTQQIKFGANLPSSDKIGAQQKVSALIYDSLGNASNLSLNFTKTSANGWDMSASVPSGAANSILYGNSNTLDGTPDVYAAAGQLEFTSIPQNGSTISITDAGTGKTYTFEFTNNPAGVQPGNIAVDLSTGIISVNDFTEAFAAAIKENLPSANRFSADGNKISIVQSTAGSGLTIDASKTLSCVQSACNPREDNGIPTGVFNIPQIDNDIKNAARIDFNSTTAADYTGKSIVLDGKTYTFTNNGNPTVNPPAIAVDIKDAISGANVDPAKMVTILGNVLKENATEPERFIASGMSLEILPSATGGDIAIDTQGLGNAIDGIVRDKTNGWVSVQNANVTLGSEFDVGDHQVEQGSLVPAVRFNSDGTPKYFNVDEMSIQWANGAENMDGTPGNGTKIKLDMGNAGTNDGLTNLSGDFTTNFMKQDGAKFGSYAGVHIDESGVVTALFDNGETRPIAILPLATFSNPNGMEALTGNSWIETDSSGQALLKRAGTNGAGEISSNALENSTVDLATEFSNMIVTQRAYSAATKIITTADEMLDELTRMT
ncbi:MAG: flagellar hook-basal body complex protein [Pseudomonadota bacterium]|nr:flagellar hook-basal body complex protein [Pseudomonadota bacterium]